MVVAVDYPAKLTWRVAFGLAAPAAVVAAFDIHWAGAAFVILVVIGFVALVIDIVGWSTIVRRFRRD
ncbi:hypothetical protein [Nocardia panacis]|uniref:hypothetical protein n=1 Tax=Nocardia panacis TaxID=2340916 RepID=UPI0011C3997C|nr:hypothetical protein [Nocardia panacis]